jgi:uncharacterized protein
MTLFERDHVIGVFRGFSGAGMEFHADLVLPYKSDFNARPVHGQFVLVALESENEAVLGRITEVSAQGRLASTAGEDYAIRAVKEDRPIPEDLRDQYLKYMVDIRILGLLRQEGDKKIFAPSHRRVPHVGAKVAFVPPDLMRELVGSDDESRGAELGFLAFGEFVYAGPDPRLAEQDWLRRMDAAVMARFDIRQLVSRRSFVFARAGFGKSNLVKLLFSGLYGAPQAPTVPKRRGVQVPVGTLIFDPDGEYFWPDYRGRPGLCDVPELADRIVVFTDRQAPSPFYSSFVVDQVKLDIRRLAPSKVISLVLPSEKLENQNVAKLRQLSQSKWTELVDAVWRGRHETDLSVIRNLVGLEVNQEMEALAARANMVRVVTALHDPSSRLLDALLVALREGKLCVVDISQMRGAQGLSLAGVLLQHIFEHNQEHFTAAEPETIPTIAVLEEAQSVLSPAAQHGDSPFVAWVKEGRKYDLGAVLVTQQPGSLGVELLSQGDNWFVFHLLSAGDLQALKKANAHFSDDLLSSLLNEPLVGHGVVWSSAGSTQYPLSVRVLSFEQAQSAQDPDYTREVLHCYASQLRKRLNAEVQQAISRLEHTPSAAALDTRSEPGVDIESALRQAAVKGFAESDVPGKIADNGWPWRGVIVELEEAAPDSIADKNSWANQLVPEALNAVFGTGAWGTEKRPRRDDPTRDTLWVVLRRTGDQGDSSVDDEPDDIPPF